MHTAFYLLVICYTFLLSKCFVIIVRSFCTTNVQAKCHSAVCCVLIIVMICPIPGTTPTNTTTTTASCQGADTLQPIKLIFPNICQLGFPQNWSEDQIIIICHLSLEKPQSRTGIRESPRNRSIMVIIYLKENRMITWRGCHKLAAPIYNSLLPIMKYNYQHILYLKCTLEEFYNDKSWYLMKQTRLDEYFHCATTSPEVVVNTTPQSACRELTLEFKRGWSHGILDTFITRFININLTPRIICKIANSK